MYTFVRSVFESGDVPDLDASKYDTDRASATESRKRNMGDPSRYWPHSMA